MPTGNRELYFARGYGLHCLDVVEHCDPRAYPAMRQHGGNDVDFVSCEPQTFENYTTGQNTSDVLLLASYRACYSPK